MEFVEGITLRTWMERRWAEAQSPPPSEVRSIVRQTASALGAAHARGLVHCDVKPENILLVKEGDVYRVRVADFGIARRIETPAGPVTGTLDTSPPSSSGAALPTHAPISSRSASWCTNCSADVTRSSADWWRRLTSTPCRPCRCCRQRPTRRWPRLRVEPSKKLPRIATRRLLRSLPISTATVLAIPPKR